MQAGKRRSNRQVLFVGAMKRGEYPNARSLAEALSICPRTLQRDIAHLQLDLDAPIAYDSHRHGYFLTDPEWVFPLAELRGDLLYASLLGERLSLPLVPPPFRADLEAALVFATGATADLDPAIFETVHAAWRDTCRVRLRYESDDARGGAVRDVDIHALFLAQGAWYARAYCHLRQGWRSLALHRIREACPLDAVFRRDPAALAEIRAGNVFDYAAVRDVTVFCHPGKARLLAEREWFPGQESEWLPDGTLRLAFAEAPRPELVWWVLSYAGMIEVVQPPDLREEILQAAQRLSERHLPLRKGAGAS
jgi:predicted DNA-binding transcriptional regulator YafY